MCVKGNAIRLCAASSMLKGGQAPLSNPEESHARLSFKAVSFTFLGHRALGLAGATVFPGLFRVVLLSLPGVRSVISDPYAARWSTLNLAKHFTPLAVKDKGSILAGVI